MGRKEDRHGSDGEEVTTPHFKAEQMRLEIESLTDICERLATWAGTLLQYHRRLIRQNQRLEAQLKGRSIVELVDLDWADDDVVTLVFADEHTTTH
jgi:hypothetical protein